MSTYHHGDLRAALLRAAGKRLEKQGIAALSLRGAARRAGVSHNAPYRHFADREALLAALAAEGFHLLGQELDKASGREMGEAYVRFALQHPQRFRLMFGGRIALDKHPQLRAAASSAFDQLQAAFSGYVLDARTAAAAAWSLVHGLSHLILDGHFEQRDEEFVKRVLGAVRFAVGPQRSA
ncbi:MAG TPA: WHG domain-containing protein [Burkholderiales bacterium]|nr:WHG domain-containing protein [Burkholderiales bacterium]